jgi:hypothetical protein
MHKLPDERIRMRVEICLQDQQSGQHRHQHIEGKKSRLQRAFHLSVSTPRPNRDPASRARMLPIDPSLAPLRNGLNARSNPGDHPGHSRLAARRQQALTGHSRTLAQASVLGLVQG